MEFVCIVCPNGCRLTAEKAADGSISVSGSRCPRGQRFAAAELTHPLRSLTTTVATSLPGIPVAPVRTRGEIPREKLQAAMAACSTYTLARPVVCGEVLIPDLAGTGVALIATRTLGR